LKHLAAVLGVVCAAQFVVILVLLHGGSSSRAGPQTAVPNQMIDVGRAIAVHQEQKQHMTKLVDHSRATSDIIKESCFKSKEKTRKLLEDVLRENAELREGRFLEKDRLALAAKNDTAKRDEAQRAWEESHGKREVPRFGAVLPGRQMRHSLQKGQMRNAPGKDGPQAGDGEDSTRRLNGEKDRRAVG
jgi:hypothetical protein